MSFSAMSFQESQAALENDGFLGFHRLTGLDTTALPKGRGIYIVLCASDDTPSFLISGTGGRFKGKDPNVPVDVLQGHWIQGQHILYIGKAGGSESAATLRQRVGAYLKFGRGAAIGHWGGRHIWQIANSAELIVCWKETPEHEPRDVELAMLRAFKDQNGRLPFANLAS
jgi:hypothetical protein